MSVRFILVCCMIFFAVASAVAQTAPVDTTAAKKTPFPVSGSLQLSALLKSGDIKASSLNSDLLLKALTGSVEHFLLYSYEHINNQQSGSKIKYTNQDLQYQMRFPLVKPVKAIIGGEVESNDIRNIKYRYLGYAGIAVSLIHTPHVTLDYNTAGGYGWQKLDAALGRLQEDFPIFYTGGDFIWTISEANKFISTNSYFIEFATPTEHRLIGSASLKSRLSKVLSFTFQFEYDYSSRTFEYLQVAEQNAHWNLTLSAGLQADF